MSGTPQENGSFGFVLRISDSAGHTLIKMGAGCSLAEERRPSASAASDLGVAVIGQNFSGQLFACCLPNAFTWSLLSGSLPAGLSLSPDGIISGPVAASNAVGPYKFLVKAADAINPANFAIRQLTITVSNLSITSGNPPTGNVGTPFQLRVHGNRRFRHPDLVTGAVPVPAAGAHARSQHRCDRRNADRRRAS